MLFAFIDESYTAERFYLSAVVVREQNMRLIADALNQTREYARGFGVYTPNVELHAHSLMSGRDGWEAVHRQPRAAISIFRHALTQLSQTPIRVFISGVDVTRLNARYSYPEPPYQVALKALAEKLNAFAASKNEQVLLLADEVQDQDLHASRMNAFQVSGTGGYWPTKLTSVELPMLFAPSHESPGIQAADLAVYLYRRIDAHLPANPKSHDLALQLWKILSPRVQDIRRWDP